VAFRKNGLRYRLDAEVIYYYDPVASRKSGLSYRVSEESVPA
jgi:hypothetical protein